MTIAPSTVVWSNTSALLRGSGLTRSGNLLAVSGSGTYLVVWNLVFSGPHAASVVTTRLTKQSSVACGTWSASTTTSGVHAVRSGVVLVAADAGQSFYVTASSSNANLTLQASSSLSATSVIGDYVTMRGGYGFLTVPGNSTVPVVGTVWAGTSTETRGSGVRLDAVQGRVQVTRAGYFLLTYSVEVQAGDGPGFFVTFANTTAGSVAWAPMSQTWFGGTQVGGASAIVRLAANEMLWLTIQNALPSSATVSIRESGFLTLLELASP